MVNPNDQLWGYMLRRGVWAWCKAGYLQSQKQEAALLSEFMPEPTSQDCKSQTATGTWMCGCSVPAWWIPGALALEHCLVLSHLVTMTAYALSAVLLFLFADFQMAFALLAVSCVRPQLVHATLCAWQPACCVDCLSVVRRSAYHLSLANPLRIFFFQRFIYTGLFPKGWIDNMIL